MPAPEIKVRVAIDGQEYETQLAKLGKKTEESGSVIGKVWKELGALAAAVGLAKLFKEAIDEAAKAEQSVQRLGLAVNNAGGNFRQMQPEIDKTIDRLVRMTTATDDDLRVALANMTTVSGDAKGSLANLGLAADVAAYKHLSLEEAGTLVGKAMSGNSKVLREFGITAKDVANPMEELRKKVGGFAETEGASLAGTLIRIKNNFGEVLESIGRVIVGQTNMVGVGSGLVDMLGNVAQWIERNEAEFQPFIQAIVNAAAAWWDVAKTIYTAVAPALGPTLRLVMGALLLLLNEAKAAVLLFGATWSKLASVALDALGQIVSKGGSVLKIFGVQVVKEYGDNLITSAKNLAKTADDLAEKAKDAAIKGWKDTFAAGKEHATNMETVATTVATTSVGKVREATAAELKERKKAHDDAVDYANKNLQVYTDSVDKQRKITTEALDKLLQGPIKGQGSAWQQIAQDAKAHNEEVIKAYDPAKRLADTAADKARHEKETRELLEAERAAYQHQVQEVGQLAGGLIDAGTAMGALDDHAANALKSVVNMGTSIATMIGSGFTAGGMIGLIGGLANLIGGWANNPAEKARMEVMRQAIALHEKNIAALEKNTGAIELGASGRTIKGVQSALQSALKFQSEGGFLGAQGLNRFYGELANLGISKADAQKLFADFGFSSPEEAFASGQLGELFRAMQQKLGGLTTFGKDFGGQLKAVEEGFGILGTTDADTKLAEYKKLAGRFDTGDFGKALDAGDLGTLDGRTKVAAALRALFRKMQAGERVNTGGLTSAQIVDFIKSWLPLLAEADGINPAILDSLLPPGTGGSVPDGLGKGDIGGFPRGPVVGVDFTRSVSSDAERMIRSGDVTTFTGAITLNVYQNPDEDGELFAQRVAEKLGKRYLAQYAALGVPASTFSGVA